MWAGWLLGVCELSFAGNALRTAFPTARVAAKLVAHMWVLLIAVLFLGCLLLGWLYVLSNTLERKKKGALAGALWAMLLSPLCAWATFGLFAGGKMQRVPLHTMWSCLLLLGMSLGIGWGLPKLLRFWTRLRSVPVLKKAMWGLVCVGAVFLFHIMDLRVLPRLYPWFHAWLQVGKIVAAVGFGTLLCSWFPKQNKWLLLGLLLLVMLPWQGVRSARKLDRAKAFRAFVLQHTTLPSTLLRLFPTEKHSAPVPVIQDEEAPPPKYVGPRLSGKDVFLITIDALRQDAVSSGITPTLAKLGKEGVVFARAYTQVPHTSFAIATMLTGKPVYALSQFGHDAGTHTTLPLLLRNYRYKTAAFYPPNVFFVERDRLKVLEQSAYGFEYVKMEYLPGDRRTQQVLDFLETEKPEQVFVWIHYLEPHEPYDSHPGDSDRNGSDKERYLGEVRFVDREVHRLVEYLDTHRPGALVVVAADHGEEFGEHGGRYHGTTLYEEQTRVPLLMVDTAQKKGLSSRRYEEPVGLLDVGPTLLGLLDIEPPLDMRGLDLSPWLLSGAEKLPNRTVFAELGTQKMVVHGQHKLMCDLSQDHCQLFDLAQDPQEKRNRAEADPGKATELRGRLDGLLLEAQKFEHAAREKQGPGQAVSPELQAMFSRARLGDARAVPHLLSYIEQGKGGASMWEAVELSAKLLAQKGGSTLSRNAAEHARLVQVLSQAVNGKGGTPREERWAAILVSGLGVGTEPWNRLLGELLLDEGADAEQRICASLVWIQSSECQTTKRRACVAQGLSVLDLAMSQDDPDKVRPLLLFLGESREESAMDPLLRQLEHVRSRVDVVKALGRLGKTQAVPRLGEVLLLDPYVPVRAEAGRALFHIGGTEAHALLEKARKTEREEAVRTVLFGLLR